MKGIKSPLTLKGEKRMLWMPQKSGRYPPIHDQIDTPTDFSVAVWKWQQKREMEAGESQREAEQR